MKNKACSQLYPWLTSAALVLSAPAQAQAPGALGEEGTGESLEEIVVTGSRIKRTQFDTLQASIVVDAEAIEERAAFNVADVLNEQPAFGVGAGPRGGSSGALQGQNQLNFLGLGSARTLTLVNGKRFVSSRSIIDIGSAGLQVDLNNIPVAMIDRVETIAVGGAPIYGTDAIAGTVNVIMKKDYEGLDIVAQGGMSVDENDLGNYRFSVVKGLNFNNDRGNVTFAVDYSSSNGLKYSDRPDTAGKHYDFQGTTDPNSPYNLLLTQPTVIAITSDRGVPLLLGVPGAVTTTGFGAPLNPGDPNSPISQFDANGNLVPFILGRPTVSPVFREGGDGLLIADSRSLAHDVDRLNANVFLNYELSDSIRFNAEGWFAETKTVEKANEGVYQSGLFASGRGSEWLNFRQGAVPVLLSNPFVTPSTRATIAAGLANLYGAPGVPNIDTDGDGVPDDIGFYVDRNLKSVLGDSPTRTTNTLYRTVVGIEGEFQFAGKEYAWDLSYTYGEVTNKGSDNRVVRNLFYQATDVVLDPATGQPACRDPSGGCVPLNVMTATVDPAAAAFVTMVDTHTSVNEQHVAMANIAGPLFGLPAGEVQAALGFDYRVEKAVFTPSEANQAGIFDGRSPALSGKYHTNEFYGELLVPLLSRDMGIPFVDTLELEGAIRNVDNSIAGSDVTWTGGMRFRPIPDIEFRGNVTQSIRAPATSEIFLPITPSAAFGDDPCDARYIDQGNFPERRAANCAAEGIPAGFGSLISDAFQAGPNFVTGGNPDLLNETADSWSAGVILRPRFAENLTLAADWIHIEIADAIQSQGAQSIMEACYDSAAYPNEPSCERFSRGPDFQVNGFRTGFVNIGNIAFEGLSTSILYSLETDRIGNFAFNLSELYTHDKTIETGIGNEATLVGQVGHSKHKVNFNVQWQKGRLRIGNLVQWYSSANFDNSDGPFTRDLKGVPDWWVANTSASYQLRDNLALQLNVNNTFDKKAPLGTPRIFGAAGGDFTYFAGFIGRTVLLTARMSFE